MPLSPQLAGRLWASGESAARKQGHGDTLTTAQHTRSLGFDARTAAASRHQSTTVRAMRKRPECQNARGPKDQRTRERTSGPAQHVAAVHWSTHTHYTHTLHTHTRMLSLSRTLFSPQALVSPQRGQISKGNKSDPAQASRCTRRRLT